MLAHFHQLHCKMFQIVFSSMSNHCRNMVSVVTVVVVKTFVLYMTTYLEDHRCRLQYSVFMIKISGGLGSLMLRYS